MAEVQVKIAELTLTTVKLSAKILKQIPRLDYQEAARMGLTTERGHVKDEVIIGWIHGSAFARDDEWKSFFLVRTGEGSYGLIETIAQNAKYSQIYVS